MFAVPFALAAQAFPGPRPAPPPPDPPTGLVEVAFTAPPAPPALAVGVPLILDVAPLPPLPKSPPP